MASGDFEIQHCGCCLLHSPSQPIQQFGALGPFGPIPARDADLDKMLAELKAQQAQGFLDAAPAAEGKVAHGSGATSSHFSPFNFYPTYEGMQLTALRFKEGNRKHEHSDPVYLNANWLKAFKARDVAFFRDRAGHALEHLIAEMRGNDDNGPGGNLGAVGWWHDAFAFVKKNDPFLYGAIQGKWNINDKDREAKEAQHG